MLRKILRPKTLLTNHMTFASHALKFWEKYMKFQKYINRLSCVHFSDSLAEYWASYKLVSYKVNMSGFLNVSKNAVSMNSFLQSWESINFKKKSFDT